jgi:hypothetical protein
VAHLQGTCLGLLNKFVHLSPSIWLVVIALYAVAYGIGQA